MAMRELHVFPGIPTVWGYDPDQVAAFEYFYAEMVGYAVNSNTVTADEIIAKARELAKSTDALRAYHSV